MLAEGRSKYSTVSQVLVERQSTVKDKPDGCFFVRYGLPRGYLCGEDLSCRLLEAAQGRYRPRYSIGLTSGTGIGDPARWTPVPSQSIRGLDPANLLK